MCKDHRRSEFPPRKRRRFPYSLAFLFAVVTALCFVFAFPSFIATTVLLLLAVLLALLGFVVLCQNPMTYLLNRFARRSRKHVEHPSSSEEESAHDRPPTITSH